MTQECKICHKKLKTFRSLSSHTVKHHQPKCKHLSRTLHHSKVYGFYEKCNDCEMYFQ